ncbi:MAG: TonB family protein [Rhodocyclaceae bacterium]|nr:TonB family protein [Rhodocyclaceae bacterium]
MNIQNRQQLGFLPSALVISLMLHAMVLGRLSPHAPPTGAPAAGPLKAILKAPSMPAEPAVTVPDEPPRPLESPRVAEDSRHTSPLVRTDQASVVSKPPTPEAAHLGEMRGPAPASAPPGSPVTTSGPAANATQGGSPEAVGGISPAPQRESSDDGLDSSGLRQYRVALAGQAKRFKRYPRQAIDEGTEGTAEIRISIAPDRPFPATQVVRSSGAAILDAAALEIIRQATTRTPVPESLRGKSFTVNLPVVFDLSEQ